MNRPARYAWIIVLILVPSGLAVQSYLRPQATSNEIDHEVMQDITIGVLIDKDRNIPGVQVIINYAEEEINGYCDETNAKFKFNFQIRSAEGQAAIALENVANWNEEGVNLIIGPPWSSMFCVARSYSNDNGVIIFSHGSTSPLLAVEDNGYRLRITDFKESQITVRRMEEAGIDSVLILERSDSWAGGIANEIESIFDGEIKRFKYDVRARRFTEYIAQAELQLLQMEGESKAIIFLGFDEMAKLINATADHPTMTRVPWFTTGANLNSTDLHDVAPQVSKMDITGYAPIIPKSARYDELNQLYMAVKNETLGYDDANIYDISWIYALTVIEAGGTEADDIKEALPVVTSQYRGITGNCTLDSNGDRNTAVYGIYRLTSTGDRVYAEKIDEIAPVFAEVSEKGSVH
jgi:ABC-type branched-subunit amino acid transport system substrate-binding protein